MPFGAPVVSGFSTAIGDIGSAISQQGAATSDLYAAEAEQYKIEGTQFERASYQEAAALAAAKTAKEARWDFRCGCAWEPSPDTGVVKETDSLRAVKARRQQGGIAGKSPAKFHRRNFLLTLFRGCDGNS
jgi:hypothetical protein